MSNPTPATAAVLTTKWLRHLPGISFGAADLITEDEQEALSLLAAAERRLAECRARADALAARHWTPAEIAEAKLVDAGRA